MSKITPATDIRKRWLAPLEEICEVIQGQSPPGSTYNTRGDGLPFFQGKAEFGGMSPIPSKWCTAPKKIAQPGDVLISIRAPVGPTNMCHIKACIGRGLAALRPKEGLRSKYLLYAMRASASNLVEKGTGSTFDAVSGKDLREHKICMAHPEEQDSLIAQLESHFSRLDEGVEALKRVQANLKRFRASVLKAACEGRLVPTEADLARKEKRSYETGAQLLDRILKERRTAWEKQQAKEGRTKKCVEPAAPDTSTLPDLPEGWVWATIAQLIVEPLCNGVSVKGSDIPPGIRALRLSAMSDSGFDYNDIRYLPLKPSDIDDLWIKKGDFYISRGNGSLHLVGRGTIAQKPPQPIIYPDTMIRIRFSERFGLGKWISLMWSSRLVRSQIEQKVKTTAGIYKIAQSQVEQIHIPLPPLVEQNRIIMRTSILKAFTDHMMPIISIELERSNRLRQSTLQKILFQDNNSISIMEERNDS